MENLNEIDVYISRFTIEQQKKMNQLRQLIHQVCPDVTEKISWDMPTFLYYGNLIHFAQNKNHIGLYPGNGAVAAFQDRLKDYTCTKGGIHLSMEEPLPARLIRDIIIYSMEENKELDLARKAKRSKSSSPRNGK